MSTDLFFDLVILGGGPAGSRAAFRAAGKGMKTALVESGFLGGTCLNTGCIPTKYLLGASACLPLLGVQKKYKVASGDICFDFAALQRRKERFVGGSRQSLEKQLAQAGVTLIKGRARFTGPTSLSAGPEAREVRFASCIVATGSVPASFPGLVPDGKIIRSSAGLLALTTPPSSLIIVGGGAIGLELGEIYRRLGSEIILAEVAERILPGEDPEVSQVLHSHLAREGWTIHTGRRIREFRGEEGRATLRFEDGEALTAEAGLLAVGRKANASCLDPEAAGLALDARGWLATDAALRCAGNIYAVGDVNGRVLLAHAADHQARHAVDHIAGEAGDYLAPPMPSCVYGTMEVMRVGPTLAQLAAEGGRLAVSRAPFAGNAIAQSSGHTQGMARMLWRDDVLRGVSAVGHGASHLVSAAALLVGGECGGKEPLPLIFAHPTLDEILETAMMAVRESV